jgi:hypothetical protein
MKRSHSIPLSVLAALVTGGCDYDPAVSAQRDVYTRMEDCVADWGDVKLCQQMEATAAADAQAKAETGSAGTPGAHLVPFFFYGPTYYGGNRVAYLDDGARTYAPTGNRSSRQLSTQVRASSLPSHVSRGGFGKTGRSVSSAGRPSSGS